jgi:hypothetical protein
MIATKILHRTLPRFPPPPSMLSLERWRAVHGVTRVRVKQSARLAAIQVSQLKHYIRCVMQALQLNRPWVQPSASQRCEITTFQDQLWSPLNLQPSLRSSASTCRPCYQPTVAKDHQEREDAASDHHSALRPQLCQGWPRHRSLQHHAAASRVELGQGSACRTTANSHQQ